MKKYHLGCCICDVQKRLAFKKEEPPLGVSEEVWNGVRRDFMLVAGKILHKSVERNHSKVQLQTIWEYRYAT